MPLAKPWKAHIWVEDAPPTRTRTHHAAALCGHLVPQVLTLAEADFMLRLASKDPHLCKKCAAAQRRR